MASGILRTSLFINYIINLLTKHSSHQYNYVRIAVFLSNNEQIFLLLFKIMISQVRKPFGTTMLKIFLKFGKFSRSFFIFVCPLGEKVPAWASHSWSRPTRPGTVEEYEFCLCLKSTDCSLLYLSASLIFVLSGLSVEGLARENLRERK